MGLLFAWPLPTANLRIVDAMLVRVAPACNLAIAEFLFRVGPNPLQRRNAVNRVDCQTEPVGLVIDRQFHWRVDISLLLVTAHVEVAVIRATVRESVYQPRVAMEVEDDWLICCEQRIEVSIRKAMWMFCARLQFEKVDHVDEPDLKAGEIFPQQ